MKKLTRLLAFALLPLVTVAATPGQDWKNPLVPQRADSQVFRHTDGYYYFMATVPEYDRLELRRSPTIAGLATATPKVIWTKHATGIMGSHIWAPEIHFINGKWYVYFAAGGAERATTWDIRVYVLENPASNPIEGTWTEKGQLKLAWESFSLDATTFEHNGTRYLVWAQKDPDPTVKNNSNLYIAKMDTPWSITGTPVLLSRPDLAWEHIGYYVNEGPAILHKNGRFFLTYSASATDANYCMGLLTAKDDADLLDPKSWTKSQTPVFVSSDANGQYGPGHNSFTTSPDGKYDIMFYHARNYRAISGDPLYDPNRHTRAQILTFNADGTPNFGVPVPDDLPLPPAASDKGTPGRGTGPAVTTYPTSSAPPNPGN